MTEQNLSDSGADAILRRAARLPSLPAVALRVLELGDDPYAGPSEVAGVVANDPALSARLLKAANSPLYAMRRQVDNLRQAVNLLGFDAAITLALSFSLQPPANGGCINKRNYWRRSLTAAIFARVLVEHSQGGDTGRFFLAALLQDIGMLVFEQAESVRYSALLQAASSHAELARLESATFGFDHAQVGCCLLQSWNIPEPLWRAVRGSHNLNVNDAPAQSSLLDRYVHASGQLADYCLAGAPDEEALSALAQWAQDYLELDTDGFMAVIDRVATLLPDYSALFEIKLLTDQEVAHFVAEARDIRLLRNLKSLQEARDYKSRSEVLEARNRELEVQNQSDPLTGLSNRRRLAELMEREYLAAKKQGWPLSVGFLDIDHFKKVNDTYGHSAGDVVLKALARMMKEELRRSDVVARYGGEEFVVLLPGTKESDAFGLLDRLRRHIAKTRFTHDDAGISVTISIGLASVNVEHSSDSGFDSAEDLLRAADRALYAAKREGRDRTLRHSRDI
ncbi:GGDEF domain-containing protein [Acidihalobacter ferrooxydans]|uniref:diguanylate cyclase n=1 Tax=Acidihalobacter ferrooxydans TaxID=1765967 RepID=A0A1P8UGS0_9GAMM|nr:GGDEF domain-containing protein [Acidihalobacter ferrooxydans]APZ43037.1 hypothetical protein BW247_07970 [Acidihalobacter ferrooxydans]